jgi:predicted nucleic acid-binding Zn ribbon protein
MRCPECKEIIEATAAVCGHCGLILLKATEQPVAQAVLAAVPLAPKRRAEDFAGQKRRAADRETAHCEFCEGTVSTKSVRCKHCGEILNQDYFRERAQVLRSRVNYASWVAYLFGLGALLVFRPVGLMSIAAGLLLSIVYYAIPVEPPSSSKQKSKVPFLAFLKRQMRIERVHVPIPALRNKKIVLVGTPLIAALIGYSANLFLLQEPMNDILKDSVAFKGMEVSTHYEYWVVPGVVVYDLRQLSFRQTPIDVHTAFLEFAKKMKDKRYSRVELSYKGTTKFSIDGDSFRQLGEEYAKKNFDYVLYTFPRLFRPEEGVKTPEGGTDRDALTQFHRAWYGDDPMTRTVNAL